MDLSIRNFIRYLSLEKRYTNHTIESYTTDLEQFVQFLQELNDGYDILWKGVSRKEIRHFLIELQQRGMSKRTIARKVATLKSFFRFLEKQGELTTSMSGAIKMPRFEQKLPEYLSRHEIDQIVCLPDCANFEGIRDKAILELFYSSGIRLSELINIQLSDLILREDSIRVFGKGKKERILPIGSHAKNSILEYLNWRPQVALPGIQELFLLKSGKKMYAMAVQRLVKKYINQVVHLNSASPHILRHSYATHLLNRGANIRVVKDLLGHENLSTTQVYTHLSIDHLKKVYKHAHKRAKNK